MGLQNLVDRIFQKDETDAGLKSHLEGLFPRDSVQNARFSINFFTQIGLGALTEELREFIKDAPQLLLKKKYEEMLALANAASSSSSSDSSSDSESDSSSSSSSNSK
jgi:pre-mRNA-splicing factor CWC22